MKNIIAKIFMFIGYHVWDKSGYCVDDNYEEYSIIGKLGCNLFCTGLALMGITAEDIYRIGNNLVKEN